MNLKHIKAITAIAESLPYGSCTTAVIITYDRDIASASVKKSDFTVLNRNITGVYSSDSNIPQAEPGDGPFLHLLLNEEDPEGKTFQVIGKGWDSRIELLPPHALVQQIAPLPAVDGSELPPWEEPLENTEIRHLVADDFQQHTFEGMPYNLYIPKGIRDGKQYPLVLFIHDAGICHDDPHATLCHGIGATIWATQKEQEKHPCFVLAPQITSSNPPMVNDEFEADERVAIIMRLVHDVAERYPIDTKRICATGQSMGAMSICEMLVRDQKLFHRVLLVACQWNPETVGKCTENQMWIVVSEGDVKGFPIMSTIVENLRKNGAKTVHEKWKANAAEKTAHNAAERMIATGASVLFTTYDKHTVLPEGVEDSPGSQHVYTWPAAYRTEALRDWLLG